MKNVLIFLFSFLTIICSAGVLFLTGCANNLTKVNKFMLDGNNISFTLSQVWKEETSTEHDLSLSNTNFKSKTTNLKIWKNPFSKP